MCLRKNVLIVEVLAIREKVHFEKVLRSYAVCNVIIWVNFMPFSTRSSVLLVLSLWVLSFHFPQGICRLCNALHGSSPNSLLLLYQCNFLEVEVRGFIGTSIYLGDGKKKRCCETNLDFFIAGQRQMMVPCMLICCPHCYF